MKNKLIGVGLDNTDGNIRLTQSEEYVINSGSEETHEKMQEVVAHVEENLRRHGKTIGECNHRELMERVLDEATKINLKCSFSQ